VGLIRNTRAGRSPRSQVLVEVWGPEPIGAAQVDALQARFGADMAGFTAPNPAGWGLQGSIERTDQTVWASPQAFTGAAQVALSTFAPLGAVTPTQYPQDAHMTGVVLPGPGGI
jgi:hypothetical protein